MKLHPGIWHIECDDLTLTENRSPTKKGFAIAALSSQFYDVKVISTEITVKLPLKKRDIENAVLLCKVKNSYWRKIPRFQEALNTRFKSNSCLMTKGKTFRRTRSFFPAWGEILLRASLALLSIWKSFPPNAHLHSLWNRSSKTHRHHFIAFILIRLLSLALDRGKSKALTVQ